MRRDPTPVALRERVRAFVAGTSPEDFGALALAVHAWQARASRVIASITQVSPSTWRDIPAVPVELFKHLPVGTVPVEHAPVVFRTSGTTGGARGAARLWSTALYDEGALRWARHSLGDLPTRVAATLHDPRVVTDSSLAHMVSRWAPDDTTWHLGPEGLDIAGLDARVMEEERPIFVAATAFAVVEWLEHGARPLPSGSRIMVTGGFKGRVTEVSPEALYARIAEQICPDIVTEYGMTELSSQLWGRPNGPYRPPPWLRVRAMDPVTRSDVAAGEPGQLRFTDLTNVDTSVVVETLDHGVVHSDGSVSLLGRIPGSEARGCSLTIEDLWR